MLKTRTYDRLKRMILDGRLRPGQKLAERELGAQLKVSRTPVREAMSRLVQEGLVESRPRRGHFVRAIDAAAVADLYDLREALERYAVKLALKRRTPSDLAALDRLARSLRRFAGDAVQSEAEIREAQGVHELLVRAAHDGFLEAMLTQLYNRLQLFVWIDALYEDEAPKTRAEHAAIIAAFKAGDEAKLLKLLGAHLRQSKANVLRALRTRPSLTG